MSRILTTAFLLIASVSFADGLRDNNPATVRRVPPEGVEVPHDIAADLSLQINALQIQIAAIQSGNNETAKRLLPDVEIFSRAVQQALEYREFFSTKEFNYGRKLLQEGLRRANALRDAPQDEWYWTKPTQRLVVRGFRSKLDNTVQPYGLVLPKQLHQPSRLDIWFHGRGERTGEVGFIHQRMNQPGHYSPSNAIVLHPYGRYSNAFKFAGEVDVLEALEHVKQHYPVDNDRISVRGFSMGGAACWQFAVHYADQWFAANPGAGFSETPEFLKSFQKETLTPTWYEKKLWQWYDCNGYARNLLHCPTIAYSGELDIQKQAADIMAAALKRERIDLLHVIGPQTKHAIHPDSKVEIGRRMNELAAKGRQRFPKVIDFQTYTLKYNRMHWITVDGLNAHWDETTVHAERSDSEFKVATKNATAISIHLPSGAIDDLQSSWGVVIDGQNVGNFHAKSDGSLHLSFQQTQGEWKFGSTELKQSALLRKVHNLQGPIDDAFMDSFIFVAPDRTGDDSAMNQWVAAELKHASEQWRQQFRGDARVRLASEITDEEIRNANLVLFGTPRSNTLIEKIERELPITWDTSALNVGSRTFDSAYHIPLLIYPNPLNRSRYVVMNSGFTYREYAYLNNARQVPMLPDWAIVDIRTPPTSQYPGKVVAADFFDEDWKLKPSSSESSN